MHSITSSPLVTPQTPDSGYTSTPTWPGFTAPTCDITFSEAVRKSRVANRQSLAEAAAAVGISPNTLWRIETRRGSPSLAIAAALAVYFNLPAEILLRP